MPDKTVFEAILWTLGGGTLDRLPRRFGSRRTAMRRLHEWSRGGSVEHLWRAYMSTFTVQDRLAWVRRFSGRRRMPFWQDALRYEFMLEAGLGPPGSAGRTKDPGRGAEPAVS